MIPANAAAATVAALQAVIDAFQDSVNNNLQARVLEEARLIIAKEKAQ